MYSIFANDVGAYGLRNRTRGKQPSSDSPSPESSNHRKLFARLLFSFFLLI